MYADKGDKSMDGGSRMLARQEGAAAAGSRGGTAAEEGPTQRAQRADKLKDSTCRSKRGARYTTLKGQTMTQVDRQDAQLAQASVPIM